MRVAGIKRFGGPVEIIDVPGPRVPRDGEVLIAVKAAGVGNWDEGDAVLTHPLPLADQGTWAPWLLAPAALIARKPPDVEWEVAGAFPVRALTALQVLDDTLAVKAGESLLVGGAGTVTGGLIVALAVQRGVKVFATAGSSSAERASRVGATTVVDYHDSDWPEQIRAARGSGVDAAVNTAPDGAASALRGVRDSGRLATITSDPPPSERGIRVDSVYVRPNAAQLEVGR